MFEQSEQVHVRNAGVLLEREGGDRTALHAGADAPANLSTGLHLDVDIDNPSAALLLVEPRVLRHVDGCEGTERVDGSL